MMDDAAEKYWKEFEAATGEVVETRSMGQLHPEPNSKEGPWGLLILTDRSFRFKHEPSENWLSSIFRRQTGPSGKSEPIEIVVPRERLKSLDDAPRGFLSGIFGSTFPRFRLGWEKEGGGDTEFAWFSADDGRGFLAALRKAFPAKGA
jgi:hypothetical protein